MKRSIVCIIMLVLSVSASLSAQDSYYSVSGKVLDSHGNDGLKYVNVSIDGSTIGTVTNEEGEFTIKIDRALAAKKLSFTRIGYVNANYNLNGQSVVGVEIRMQSYAINIDAVTVAAYNPRQLIETAIEKIPDNYDMTDSRLTGFYREIISKRRQYIDISEAVIDIYKTTYQADSYRDRVGVLKGRKLISLKSSDTLSVKLQGGPNLPIYVDVLKARDEFFSDERLSSYDYTVEQPQVIDDRVQLVVSFSPTLPSSEETQYYGRVFIDQKNLAFTRIEYNMDMRNLNVAIRSILVKKPAGLRFNPTEVSNIITYKASDGVYRLNYIVTSMQFSCDWKRRLFATNYTVISETVVTDSTANQVEFIASRESFRDNQILSSSIGDFEDTDFWGAYNIIAPTESLENAIDKLKKRY